LLLAVAMLATLGLSAFAATDVQNVKGNGTTTQQTATADVYTTEGTEWWVVQIPADVALTWGQAGTANMSYKVASQLKDGATMSVTVAPSATSLQPKNGGTGSIAYTGTGLNTAKSFGAVNGVGTSADAVTTWDETAAVSIAVEASAFAGQPIGVYSVTLTYTVDVTAAPAD
ncbi:MAG: hypothetical protein J1F23_00755, partial [Oscillospiraceae bacterium]|nr:hypothetical protein [Oscillospiraceae bacterium]